MELKQKLVSNADLKFNKVIRTLTASDSLMWGGYNMMNVLVAVYLKDKIETDPLQVIATGFAIYMVSRAVIQIPIAKFYDKNKSYNDEAYAILVSSVIIATAVFCFHFISEAWHLYVLQGLIGLGVSINMPAWRKTFAHFLDRNHEAIEYSIYDVVATSSIAIFSILGGYIIGNNERFGLLFTVAALVIFSGGLTSLLLLKNNRIVKLKRSKE